MNQTRKFLSIFALAALLMLTFITPAQAFDGRGGDKVVIGSAEVVNDDLYVSSQEFVLDGRVNGDVIAFGQIVTINGMVDGDLMAFGQTVVVNGEVTGSIRSRRCGERPSYPHDTGLQWWDRCKRGDYRAEGWKVGARFCAQ